MSAQQSAVPSAWALRMGYGGLIPFVALALVASFADEDHRTFAAVALVAYGTVITSFLGAIHWGLVMRDASAQSLALLAWGVPACRAASKLPDAAGGFAVGLLCRGPCGVPEISVAGLAVYAPDPDQHCQRELHCRVRGVLVMRLCPSRVP